MTTFRMKLPDVGEGVAEAEIVSWLVAVGDEVTPNSSLAEVLTDKATVEVSSPVTGVVTALHGEPGDVVAVGSDLVEINTGGDAEAAPSDDAIAAEGGAELEPPPAESESEPAASESEATEPDPEADPESDEPESVGAAPGERPLAAPAVRARADALGIDLAEIAGSGPHGRVTHADLDRLLTSGQRASGRRPAPPDGDGAHPEAVRGVRRRIAERLSATWADVPHITYVDAVDITELERLRHTLNDRATDGSARLTLLPFLAAAIAIACRDQPHINAHYDHASETLTRYDAVHVGIATQTPNGLLVPVVRSVESRSLRQLAAEIAAVTAAARDGKASRQQLAGSTLTITSLGAIGGLVTTPILNAPEVAIVGVNKIETRPLWRNGSFEPRRVLNLSSSFDHRIVDGWDAATFVQRIKVLLETPALLFVDED